ncbi:hypothetical protein, partial [Microcystis aeruginosa]|uniref:hypothetical protein n=1 Tax=Microcystis aeruginosa TaxID=1126 RepID=UPI0008FFB01F
AQSMICAPTYFWLRVIIAELGQNQSISCFQVMKYRKAAIRSRNRSKQPRLEKESSILTAILWRLLF